MKRITFLTLGLLAGFILSACAPGIPVSAPTVAAVEPLASAPAPSEAVPAVEEAPVVVTEVPEETSADEAPPVAVATSRGDQIEATDPATVNIASGQPQLIEFFAFW
ncbi:MAG: hypothetical protein L3J16_07675 [Anaerolineales bacterium]|nr:hypothetical protein [Anaerolineales bacterium]